MSEFWHSPAIPHIESRRSCKENTCYKQHTHERFSIGLIDAGSTVFSGAGSESLELSAGDVIIIPAGHVHACNPESGTWKYQMIHADETWIADLLPADTTLFSGIHVYTSAHIHSRFSAANELLFSNASSADITDGFGQAFKECAKTRPSHVLTAHTEATLLISLAPVLEKLRLDEQNPVLEELAAIAGMSKYQLIRSMKRSTGLPPLAWRHNQRVITARGMLRLGHSLADTAHVLGFVDQSHFHRVFRSHVAASPGSYRSEPQ
ncbi:AraC family transcriptional regulator [Arthrobacter sp. MYb227]|uniref:helix-turn-helix transcriptional regulator n=1 Tax=Arthrobacter sp. MYb227 TaxID=1848601 RepID=UPI000CFBD762|nr:AraC family transcriptional regulator [Arthrobacter sp. MYb227]PQZ92939.1 AraC family transcriptional regulator [Arthrobacter sp. MYb227]